MPAQLAHLLSGAFGFPHHPLPFPPPPSLPPPPAAASLQIYLVCDEDAVVPVAKIINDSYWECYMHATVRTKLVCGIVPPPAPPPAPPHAGNEYRCVDNKCENTGPGSGVSNTSCAASCG